MYLPWIERAHQHGLRLMVALACHSRNLADLQARPMSDWEAGQVQIRYVKELAARNSSWMAGVRTPEEARAVISGGRLAIILGLELDTLGNLDQPHGTPISDSTLQDLVADIVNMDVRYVFPVHLNDNTFAGMALYKAEFMASSASAGRPVETAPDGNVTWKPPLTSGPGVVNAKGLSNAGERLLRLLMDEGMLIDIDHMSWASTQRALQLATEDGRRYPLVSGHATFLELAPREDEHDGPNESRKKAETLRTLRELGSYVGVQPTTLRVAAHPQAGGGSVDDADGSSTAFNRAYRYAVHHMGGRVAIGTDLNGLASTSSPRFGPQGAHRAPQGQ
jgi:microsomal dipeptidase-like Zn-dependent dipeptidase